MIKSVTQWLDATAQRLPNKAAFATEFKGESFMMTFSQLRTAARKIGAKLAEKGYFKKPVLIFMDKTPQCVAAMLGCAYANCPYAPVDIENPEERIEKIIEKLKPSACITNEEHKSKLCGVPDVFLYDELISVSEEPLKEELLLDVQRRMISSDILYIIFTSGSTGTPKGVAVSNANIIDYSVQLSETFGFDEETVFGQSVPFFFDSTILYIYQTIKNGCTDWIIPKTSLMFPIKTVEFLNAHKCNTVYWVPTSYKIIAVSGILNKQLPQYLTRCFFVGEVMPNSVLNVWRGALPDAQFVNLFGPTEITGTFLHYEVDRDFSDEEPLPIGKRYSNCDVFLLNEDNTPTRDGDIGELCVRGVKVSAGYWNDPQKTAEVFIQNPLNPHYCETIYKTGDLAYLNDRNEFMYVGRKDFQIKHSGHRIELGEIENAVGLVDGVDLCACVFDKDNDMIVLFYVGNAEEKAIRNALKVKLQPYMLPNRYLKIDNMPRTGSGKIGRTDLMKLL